MNKKILLLIILISQITLNLFSQNIRGRITDAKSGEAMPGVIIEIPELEKGTVTNDSGFFKINKIPTGTFKMEIRFLGYKTEIVNVNKKNKNIVNVKLQRADIETQAVVISGGNFSPAHTNAVKVQSISLINKPPSESIAGFLTSVPGVDMISKGNGVTKPVIRGLTGTNILVLKDGFRLEDYQFSEDHPFLIDQTGIDRVEIIKGPASLLYGSDAIGGVINFISENPAPTGKIQGDYNAAYFSNSQGLFQNIGIKASSPKLMWGIRTSMKNHKDFYDGAGRQVLNSRFNRDLAKAFLIYNAKNAIFRLHYEFSRSRFGMSIAPALSLVKDNSRKNKVFYQDLKNHFISSQNTFFAGNNMKIKANFSYENNERALKAIDSINPPIHMLLQTLSYETKAEFAKNQMTLITGIQGYFKDNHNLKNATSSIIPDYFLNTNAVFSLIKWNIFNGFFLQTGLRYEYSNVKIPHQDYYNRFNTDTSLFFKNLSGSFGATYKLNNFINLRTNFASGYRMPNLPELTQYGVHGARFEQGSMKLNSQRSFEGDFSVHIHSKTLLIDLATFYNKIDNYIFLSPTNKYADNGMQIYQYMQNNADIYGFEAGTEFWPIKKLELKLTYNYTIGKQYDEYLPLIPQNKLRVNMDFSVGNSKLFRNVHLNLNTVYAFAQNKVSDFEQTSAAYYLLNSSLSFQTNLKKQRIIWQIACDNILNAKYNDHLSTLRDVGFFDMGRSFSISLKIPFTADYK